MPLPNGRTVLLRVSPQQWRSVGPRGVGWVYVSGEARSGYTGTFDPSPSVIVNHNLGRIPSCVSVRTTGGVLVDVNTVHLNSNQLHLQFDVPISGTVEIS